MQRMRVPTDPDLKSRWTALVLVIGLLAILGMWLLGFGRVAIWILATLPLAAAIGQLWPDRTLRAYEAWDRVAKKARRAARLWLTGIVFSSIGVVGLLGSRLQRDMPSPEESGWLPKEPLAEGSHAGESDIPSGAGATAGWTGRYVSWAWRSGNAWSVSLLPALALLKAVEGESRGSLGGDVYTLY